MSPGQAWRTFWNVLLYDVWTDCDHVDESGISAWWPEGFSDWTCRKCGAGR